MSTGPAAAGPRRARWLPIVLAVWAGLTALLLAINWSALGQHEFHDPDDQLRLQQVRDLLAGQGWYDLRQYRIDAAGGGVPMHWSRLVDIPLALVMLVLRPLVGVAGAETAALVIVPAMTLLAAMLLVGWIAARTLPRPALPMALLALALAVPVMVQVLPARIDHHGWQIACVLGAVAALLDPRARRGGAITGACLALWMAISFEGLPLSAWIFAVLALGSLVDRRHRPRLVAAVRALAGVSILLFLATRGPDLAQHCDTIAPVHLAAFAMAALAVTLAERIGPASRIALLAGLGVAGAGALAAVLLAAPQCTKGSFDMLDPVVRSVWYDNVQEGKPITMAAWHLMAQYCLPMLVGLYAAVRLARRHGGKRRAWWSAYALILAGAIAISAMVPRAAAASGALACIPLGWLLSQWMGSLRRPHNPLLRVGELVGVAALILTVLLPVMPVMGIETLAGAGEQAADEAAPDNALCSVRAARASLAALPPGGILAPLDLGPAILIETPRSVLATGHHRGARAIRLTIDAFTGSPERARQIMTSQRLPHLAICPDMEELKLYAKRSPGGFAAQLLRGQVPGWLVPVPLPQPSGLRMWTLVEWPSGRDEAQRHAVDAVALARRRRPVVEDVPEMSAAGGAMLFGPGIDQLTVSLGADRTGQRGVEAGPAGAAVELGLRIEQLRAASGAGEYALALFVVERARIRALRRLLPQHGVRGGREAAAPFRRAVGDAVGPRLRRGAGAGTHGAGGGANAKEGQEGAAIGSGHGAIIPGLM